MAHCVVRTDKMYGTQNDTGLASAMYMGSGAAKTAIDNGNVVKLEGLMDGQREVYTAVTPAADDDIANIYLVATEEIDYTEINNGLEYFQNAAGDIVRCYMLHTKDIFSVTADGLDGITSSTKVGDVVELQAGTKLNVVAEATSGSTVVGEIIEIASAGRFLYYVIQVA